jgi:hypothetical protein
MVEHGELFTCIFFIISLLSHKDALASSLSMLKTQDGGEKMSKYHCIRGAGEGVTWAYTLY